MKITNAKDIIEVYRTKFNNVFVVWSSNNYLHVGNDCYGQFWDGEELETEEGKTWEEEESARSDKENGNMVKKKLNLLSKWNETTHEQK